VVAPARGPLSGVRIAFVHNLRRGPGAEEAEFDSPQTVAFISGALARLGHDVVPVDVSARPSVWLAELERAAPDLVFNTAEGRRGPLREALFPALFDELGLAYAGSGPMTMALSLDKVRTKAIVAAHGVQVAPGLGVRSLEELGAGVPPPPLIVKPNFEGSSAGIHPGSVVEDERRLREVVAAALAAFPAGVVVERFVPGRDVTVALLEGAGGALPAVDYAFPGSDDAGAIYDFRLKNEEWEEVSVRSPAALDGPQAREVQAFAAAAFAALECRDFARADFRLGEDGTVTFLELNALPSLEEGAGIYAAAAAAGLDEDAVIGAIVGTAARRYGL
jgi:D-alanine-D-alanine ligase